MFVLADTMQDLMPVMIFGIIMMTTWFLLTKLSSRNSQAEERLERLGRPKSLSDMDLDGGDEKKFSGLREAIANLGGNLQPKSELEQNALKLKLLNAGFRSEFAPAIYQGLRAASGLGFLFLFGGSLLAFNGGFSQDNMMWAFVLGGIGFYLPGIVLWHLKSTRQKEIFLTLPDALDLLVVCVESGLGLDAGLRKVNEELKVQAPTICEELTMANMQLQMGRVRRDVLHDLGVRTGVDDMRALAAILIQADRFGSSIAQALRVQSDSMRTKRRQLAEEKAAKTAVQLIFPLVLFIFPAIFVVLVGPAAIQIQKNLLSKGG